MVGVQTIPISIKRKEPVLKTVPKWEDVTVTNATPEEVRIFMYLYICLRVSESSTLSHKVFRLEVISALVMHSSKSSYSAHFPFLILLHIL